MTADGTILLPPSRWSRLVAVWRALPPGAVPGLLLAVACLGGLVILLFGLALIVLPALVVLALVGFLLRGLSRPRR